MSLDLSKSGAPRRELRRKIGINFLRGLGWTMSPEHIPAIPKMVIIAEPHTSNWDLPLMLGGAYTAGLEISWLGKDTIFRGPGDPFFSWLGGVPVDRSAATGMVQQVAEIFAKRERLALAIPPSGTRQRTDGWKTGFYWIAHTAGVPIVASYLDYSTKTAGFGPALMPTGDIEADFAIFREFYKEKRGKFPEWESEVRVRPQRDYEAKTRKKVGPIQLLRDVYHSTITGKDAVAVREAAQAESDAADAIKAAEAAAAEAKAHERAS